MSQPHFIRTAGSPHIGRRGLALLGCLACLLAPWSVVRASRPISEHRPAEPAGAVEIQNVSGSVDVQGWDRNEIEVAGTAGDGVDQVEVTSSAGHSSVHVITHGGHFWGSSGEAKLIVHVPSHSSVSASLVSADLEIAGVLGNLEVRNTSGEVKGETGADVHVGTVSGDIRLTAHAAKAVELKTISGDIDFKGGGGEVEITTVSGTVHADIGEMSRGRFKSISGDWTVSADLKAGSQIEGESVSGDIAVTVASPPGAEIDIQTLTGDISNCFGPKPVEPAHGPGSRLQFTQGDGRGRIRLTTKSGDVKLCARHLSGGNGNGDSRGDTSAAHDRSTGAVGNGAAAAGAARSVAASTTRPVAVPESPRRRFAMTLPYVI